MTFSIKRSGPDRIIIDGEVARVEVMRRNGGLVYFTIDKTAVELVSRFRRWYYRMGYCYTCLFWGEQMNLTWLLAGRPEENYVIHHLNGDKTDNREVNLMKVTHAQHHYLEASKPNNTTGIRGISRLRDGRYCVVVGPNNRRKTVKDFITAKKLRQAFERQVHEDIFGTGTAS